MNNLVFLPGASGNTQFWNPLIAHLPKSYTKQIIHYPGFHGVAAHPDVNSFDDLTNYVVAQIQQPSILIAQSMGGIFAIATTLKGMRAKVGQSKITVILEPRSNTMKSGVHKDTLAFSMMQADEAYLYQADSIDWNIKEAMDAAVIPVTVLHQIDELVAKVAANAKAGDTIVVMSNGGFGGVHKKLLAALELNLSAVEQVS